MKGANLNVEEFSTHYFLIDYCIEKYGGRWKVEVKIIRRDTLEEMSEGIVCIDSSKEKVGGTIYDSLKAKKEFLKTEPPDWESNVREVLVLLQSLSNSIIGFSLNDMNLPDNSVEFFDFCKKIRSETLMIAKKIDQLSKQEKLDLLTTSEEYLDGIIDHWTIDNDSSLRLSIFDYYMHPSIEETDAYNNNLSRITKAGQTL